MAAPQNFRTAFHGFNREDVVHYLEYINTKHQNQVNQLTAELEELRARLEQQPEEDQAELIEQLRDQCDELRTQLEGAEAAKAELEARCAALEHPENGQPAGEAPVCEELDAYRRADRIQRDARQQAELVYFQAKGVLTEATAKVDGAASEITGMADQVMGQLTQLQMAVSASKQALQDAASMMGAIRPNP